MKLRKKCLFPIIKRVEAKRKTIKIRKYMRMARWSKGYFLTSWVKRQSHGLRRMSKGNMCRISQACIRGRHITRIDQQMASWIRYTPIETRPDNLKTATQAKDSTSSIKLTYSSDWKARRKQNQETVANIANQLVPVPYRMVNWERRIETTLSHHKMF